MRLLITVWPTNSQTRAELPIDMTTADGMFGEAFFYNSTHCDKIQVVFFFKDYKFNIESLVFRVFPQCVWCTKIALSSLSFVIRNPWSAQISLGFLRKQRTNAVISHNYFSFLGTQPRSWFSAKSAYYAIRPRNLLRIHYNFNCSLHTASIQLFQSKNSCSKIDADNDFLDQNWAIITVCT